MIVWIVTAINLLAYQSFNVMIFRAYRDDLIIKREILYQPVPTDRSQGSVLI